MIGLTWLGACSGGQEVGTKQAPDREFSQAEKAAARSLSIARNTAMEQAEGPYVQALLCRNALGSVSDRLTAAGGLEASQAQAFNEAGRILDRQLQAMAANEGKTSQEVRADLQRTATQNADMRANARIAIGCLQELMAES